MAKKESHKVEKEFRLAQPHVGYPRCFPFNKYNVNHLDGMAVVECGLVIDGDVIDQMIFTMFDAELENAYSHFREYIPQIAHLATNEKTSFRRNNLNAQETMDVNFLTASRTGNIAELCAGYFSRSALRELARDAHPNNKDLTFEITAAFLLRSTSEIHATLLLDLFSKLSIKVDQ